MCTINLSPSCKLCYTISNTASKYYLDISSAAALLIYFTTKIRLSRFINIKTNFHNHSLPQYAWFRAYKCALCHLGHTILVLHSTKKAYYSHCYPCPGKWSWLVPTIGATLIRQNLVFVNKAEYFYIMMKICPLNDIDTYSHYSVC